MEFSYQSFFRLITVVTFVVSSVGKANLLEKPPSACRCITNVLIYTVVIIYVLFSVFSHEISNHSAGITHNLLGFF